MFGFTVGNVIAVFTIVSIAASISAMVLAGPRVYFAMARDGLFAAPAARVHPRFRAPVSAIVTQAVWSGILVLSGSLSQLVSYTGFAVVLFSGVAVAARVRPAPPRAGRAPAVPCVGLSSRSGGIRPGERRHGRQRDWRNPQPAMAGVLIIALGVPVYLWMRRTR